MLLAKASATPFVQTSFVLPASKINLQSRIELIPGSQYSVPFQGQW
uniref:Uncharacterized protein n=1 Tax=Bracon brevicornis TaxID=1563983 RepID=A0A6V7JUK7_9HYME